MRCVHITCIVVSVHNPIRRSTHGRPHRSPSTSAPHRRAACQCRTSSARTACAHARGACASPFNLVMVVRLADRCRRRAACMRRRRPRRLALKQTVRRRRRSGGAASAFLLITEVALDSREENKSMRTPGQGFHPGHQNPMRPKGEVKE